MTPGDRWLRLVPKSGDERPIEVRIAEAEDAWQRTREHVISVTPDSLRTAACVLIDCDEVWMGER